MAKTPNIERHHNDPEKAAPKITSPSFIEAPTQEHHDELDRLHAAHIEQHPEAKAPEVRKHELEQIKEEHFLEKAIGGLRERLTKSGKKQKQVQPVINDELTRQVENVMEEGLKDVFAAMTPVQQQEFKLKGELAAGQIRMLMQRAKVKVKKVYELLLEWLQLIPGVSKFYLQQEAKIKADKILSLRHHNTRR